MNLSLIHGELSMLEAQSGYSNNLKSIREVILDVRHKR